MKKMKTVLCGSLLIVSLCISGEVAVYAVDPETANQKSADTEAAQGNEEYSWVLDDYGLLSDDELAEINGELSDIYDTYGYDAVLLISKDVGEDEDYRKYAAEFMQDNEIGYGDTHEGMCIFHQPDARNITIVFRGETQNDFSSRIQDKMLEKCKVYLKDDDPFGGYQSLISNLEAGLACIADGQDIRPIDISDESLAEIFIKDLLMAFGLMIIPTGILTWYQVRKMKTRVPKPNASEYTAGGGLELSEKNDIFLYETVSRTEKSKGSDGDSGSFSSGGESFSGSSSNY